MMEKLIEHVLTEAFVSECMPVTSVRVDTVSEGENEYSVEVSFDSLDIDLHTIKAVIDHFMSTYDVTFYHIKVEL